MQKIKVQLVFIFLGLFAFGVNGSNKSEVYNSYIFDRMPVWKNLIDHLHTLPDKSNEQLLELINYQYGYIGWCLGKDQKDEALVYLKLAEENLKNLEDARFKPAIINGYKSAFYGNHIALSKFSAPFIGPKSAECARLAVKLDPNEPFGYFQMGNVKYHTPPLMGGSKIEAVGFFLKARALMEKKKDLIRGDWNYLSLLVTLARTYESINDLLKAKQVYEETLKFEPEFKWVKDDLYPNLLKKIGTSEAGN